MKRKKNRSEYYKKYREKNIEKFKEREAIRYAKVKAKRAQVSLEKKEQREKIKALKYQMYLEQKIKEKEIEEFNYQKYIEQEKLEREIERQVVKQQEEKKKYQLFLLKVILNVSKKLYAMLRLNKKKEEIKKYKIELVTTKRKCLKCQEMFDSTGSNNRLCFSCKARNAELRYIDKYATRF